MSGMALPLGFGGLSPNHTIFPCPPEMSCLVAPPAISYGGSWVPSPIPHLPSSPPFLHAASKGTKSTSPHPASRHATCRIPVAHRPGKSLWGRAHHGNLGWGEPLMLHAAQEAMVFIGETAMMPVFSVISCYNMDNMEVKSTSYVLITVLSELPPAFCISVPQALPPKK